MYTQTHTYMNTFIHACMHTYMHAYILTHVHACIQYMLSHIASHPIAVHGVSLHWSTLQTDIQTYITSCSFDIHAHTHIYLPVCPHMCIAIHHTAKVFFCITLGPTFFTIQYSISYSPLRHIALRYMHT